MFGKRLKELREDNGYSMDKLIEIYNKAYGGKMNKSTLSRYENGLQEPMYTVVVNLAKIFNVSVDYMTCVSQTPTEQTSNTAIENATTESLDIGKRLKQLRDASELTQEEVGKLIGVTKATINRYETGEIDIKRTVAIKLAAVFNVLPAYIMGWTDNPTEENKPDNAELEENIIMYHRDGKTVKKKMSKEQMKMLSSMIDAIPDEDNPDL